MPLVQSQAVTASLKNLDFNVLERLLDDDLNVLGRLLDDGSLTFCLHSRYADEDTRCIMVEQPHDSVLRHADEDTRCVMGRLLSSMGVFRRGYNLSSATLNNSRREDTIL